jgi:aspartate/methionine/tyrosine aminotransferase
LLLVAAVNAPLPDVFGLQEELVALVPGVAFGDPQCLRISYATSMESLQSAMERITRAFSKLSPTPQG